MSNDTAIVDKLFYNRYWMFVEERALRSEEELNTIGFIGESTIEGALEALSQLREVKVTIPMIAEFLSEGYKLKMSDVKDAAEIFDIINQHMLNWLQICNQYGYVNPIPPIEDFEMLDRLAEKLFPYRKTVTIYSLIDPFLYKDESDPYNPINQQGGMYEPYAPKLYPYCKQVYGD